jgi:hypothetical protein
VGIQNERIREFRMGEAFFWVDSGGRIFCGGVKSVFLIAPSGFLPLFGA